MGISQPQPHTNRRNASKRVIIASRGPLSPAGVAALADIPVNPQSTLQLSVMPKRSGTGCSGSYKCENGENPASLSGESEPTEIRRVAGNLVDAVCDAAKTWNADIILLVEEVGMKGSLRRLASDAAAILKRTRIPVILIGNSYSTSDRRGVAVAAGGKDRRAKLTACGVDELLSMDGMETVVLSVSNPFFPLFSRSAVGMRSCHHSALREIHDQQAREIAEEAGSLVDDLKSAGVKAWSVGRTGEFVREVCSVAESADAALVCVLMSPSDMRRQRRFADLLSRFLEGLDIPVMAMPCIRLRQR